MNDVNHIFSNVETILLCNETLLNELEKELDMKGSRLGAVFLEMAPYLKLYTTFVNNYQQSTSTLLECQKNPNFSRFLEKCACAVKEKMRQGTSGGGYADYTLTGLLIRCIQQIPRYVLLLEQLLKDTPSEHQDLENIEKALVQMKVTANYINEEKRKAENMEKVLKVQNSLLFEDGSPSLTLVEPHRRYVREGEVSMIDLKNLSSVELDFNQAKTFYLFLFNDILVYAMPHSYYTNYYQFYGFLRLEKIMISAHISPPNYPDPQISIDFLSRSFRVQDSTPNGELHCYIFISGNSTGIYI
jgi:FYVE/RhoGEF/PH domain-containing protein 5/6